VNEVNQFEQETWDKRKILIFVGILLLLGGGLVYGFRAEKFLGETRRETKGIETQENKKNESSESPKPSFTNIQSTFEEKITDIKKEAENINVVEIATSTPQIQKVINDIMSLQNYPRNQAKEACFNACSNICGGL